MGDRLRGKRAFITAAGQGMGRAAAIAFAAEGARVWATDVDAAALHSLEGTLGRASGGSATSGSTTSGSTTSGSTTSGSTTSGSTTSGIATRVLDVTDGAAVERVAKEVGDIDVLFNCAGFVHHGTIMECSEQDWDRSFDLNIKSMYRVTRAFLPGMLRQQKGSIINMASIASSMRGLPNRLAYGTTKAAVLGFTKAIAADYVKQGIRCNAVCPGTVDTPSLQGRINAFADPVQARKDFVARQPMGRLASVDDITPLLVYLAADESAFATGVAFPVDGGMTI